MRVPERYLLSLTVTYAITTFLLSFYGSSTLDLYISVYIVEYFILTLLNSPLKPRTQRVTNILGYVLFAVFAVIVGLKVLEILGASFI